MKRIAGLIIFALLVIFQAVYPACGVCIDGASLAVSARLDSAFFRQACSAVFLALPIYKADALDGRPKDEIISRYGRHLVRGDVFLNVERIDQRRKGWTRYYPVMIDGRSFIVRIFLTAEKAYQDEVPVIFEVVIQEMSVTCQILPGINEILSQRRIEPHSIRLDLQAARSP